MPDPNYDILVEIERGVLEKFEPRQPARFFTPLQIGAGEEVLRRKFAKMPLVPEGVKQAVFEYVDSFREIEGRYRLPQSRVDIEIDMDTYRAITANGDVSGLERNAVKALRTAQARTIFQTQSRAGDTGSDPHWGLIDVGTGNGTFTRPLAAGSNTKAGAWGTATYGASDLSSPTGQILKHNDFNDGTPLVLFYPSIVEVRFAGLVPDISGNVVFFRDLAKRIYGAIEPVGDVPAKETGATAVSALTGAAETATNFEMVAVNPNWFVYAYDIPPIIRFYTNDKQDKAYLQLEVHGAVVPIPLEDTDGKVYKAMSLIDTCGA